MHRYGSLKDDPIVTGTTERSAKSPVRRYAAVHQIEAPAVAPPSTASAEQAHGTKASSASGRRMSGPQPDASEPGQRIATPASASRAPPAPDGPLPPVVEPAAVAEMLAEGLTQFEQGKVVQARRHFVAAMNGPVPEVLLALARSYDTYHLSRLPTADGAPDMQRALVLYERALERGAKEAAPDLERTRGILKIPR
ncbi:MAG: hypothetical protein AB7L90_23495 [Hyphomicrobiaceae bacterium]